MPDATKERDALAFRRASLGEAEYAARYEGLDHLYYEKDWLRGALEEAGFDRVRIEDQTVAGYANGKFRFNVFAFKS